MEPALGANSPTARCRERRLARSVRADKADDSSFRNGKSAFVECPVAPELLAKSVRLDHRAHATPSAKRFRTAVR